MNDLKANNNEHDLIILMEQHNIKPTAKADGANGHDDDPEDVVITFDPAVVDWTNVAASATIQL